MLDMKGIAGSSGSACTSGSLDPSHVLLAIGLPHETAHGSLRLTLGADTTKEDLDYTLEQIKEIVAKLRNLSPYMRISSENRKKRRNKKYRIKRNTEERTMYSEKVMDHFRIPET